MWQRLFIVTCLLWSAVVNIGAQTFALETTNDTLHTLVLKTDSTTSRWKLPYPVYQFTTGDVDKVTRYYPYGRRLFIFKNYKGHVRPLWMGSKLGGDLQDFRFIDGRVRSLESSTDGFYAVAEYEWSGFGLRFVRFLSKGTDRPTAEAVLTDN